ncbi:glycosyltransferase family 4 protein [Micromonospora psammae]|uniref:glycosyltransferase family 4 protein n=1 Tax=Micromonospora sp. CPCC 205556 TaxID=3122398 RepID=UPI002FF3565D
MTEEPRRRRETAAQLRVLMFPRDPNPYQELLRDALRDVGVATAYLPWPTASHTLNLALLPASLVWGRVRGHRLLHLHWVYPFSVPRVPQRLGQRAATAWFRLFLRLVRRLGMRLVWTAHNVLPHTPVFADEAGERRRLVAAADAVIGHSPAALRELASIGAAPRRVIVTPHGPYVHAYPAAPARAEARRRLGIGQDAPVVLFFGRISPYKGVTELLQVWPEVRCQIPGALLLVNGACPDPQFATELQARAAAQLDAVQLRVRTVPDEEVPALFAAADLVCLPFRQVTTSGSAMLALSFGKPLLVPDLAAFADLVSPAVLRYPPRGPGLRDALVRALRHPPASLRQLGSAALDFADPSAWHIAAQAHADLYRSLTTGRPAATSPTPGNAAQPGDRHD